MANSDRENFSADLAEMRRDLDALTQRFVRLEEISKAGRSIDQYILPGSATAADQPEKPAEIPASEKDAVPGNGCSAKEGEGSVSDSDILDKPDVPPEAAAGKEGAATSGAAASQGLESRIGSYWLNRVGVVALLIGFVSLLLYSFQYCGPIVRDICGLAIASGVIYLSRRRDKAAPEHKFYFEGLNALGWSLAYFVVYGMYFLEPMRVNPSLLLEMGLLSATAAGGMCDAVAFQSEATALMSSSFAYGSLILCAGSVNPDFFNLAFLVIAGALTFVGIRQKWYAAVFVCCCLFFASIFYCNLEVSPLLSSGASFARPVPGFVLNAVLIAGWLVFNSAIWVLKEIPQERRWAVTGTSLVSAFCFPQLLCRSLALHQMQAEMETVHAWIYGIVGMIYLFTARFFKACRADDLWSIHYLIGLSLINTSRWLKLSGESAFCSDLCEIALLTAFGLRFKIPVFRYFAAFWSLIAVCYWGSNWALLLCGVFASALCAHLHARADYLEVQSPFESKVFAPWYYVLANYFGFHLILSNFSSENIFPALLVQASINVVLSLHLRWKTMVVVAGLILYSAFTNIIFTPVHTLWIAALCAIVCYVMYFYCRAFLAGGENTKLARFWKLVYAICANLAIFYYSCTLLPANCISAGWGVHGLFLIALGFVLLERTFRVEALLLFGLLTLRLLLFDLATAPAIERIVSFIVAGGVFVACSYIYTWFSKNILDTNTVRAGAQTASAESERQQKE